jgi:hypothetical protein
VNYIDDDIKDYIDDIMKIYLTNHGNLVNSGDKGYIDKFIDVYLHQYIDRNRNMRIELIDKLIPIMERLKENSKNETEKYKNQLNEVKGKAKTNLNIDPALHKAIEHVNKNNLVLYWVKYLFSVFSNKRKVNSTGTRKNKRKP